MRKPNSAEKLAIFWVRRVSPSLTLLSATVGLGGILGSALVLWGLTLALQGLAPSSQAIDAWILQWLQRASPWLDPLAWVGWGLGHPIGLVGFALAQPTKTDGLGTVGCSLRSCRDRWDPAAYLFSPPPRSLGSHPVGVDRSSQQR